jgi:hypothetical protein
MSFDLSTFDFDAFLNKLTLSKTFEFETQRSLEDCIHKLRLLQPNHNWNIHWGGPRTYHEVIISQFDDHSCYYDVSSMYRGRKSRGYTRTASVNGKMTMNPETGRTTVSGEARMNAISLGVILVGVVLFLGVMTFTRFPAIFLLFALGTLAYSFYSMYQDHANLLRVVHEL